MSRRLRVIKLGGSLFDWPLLGERLPAWLAQQTAGTGVLVTGGGGMADALRACDRMHRFSPDFIHRMAVRTMSISAELVRELLPAASLVSSLNEVHALGDDALCSFCVEDFMAQDRLRRDALPEDWSVTSDSISARLASALEADELVLLKSALPPPAADLGDLAAHGYVDAFFPSAAAGLRVRCVNLRADGFAEARLP
jgi:5-(aminomethyl)-3-furanmethanol phosphate kinase